jgi:exodeoxyribonuclease X
MRTIRIIDLETTGIEPTDAVVEIGYQDICDPGGARTWQLCDHPEGAGMLVDPGRSIPPEASAVHRIVDADVQEAPRWADAADEVLLDDPNLENLVAFAAHNARFEAQWIGPIIKAPLICTFRAAMRLWPDAPGHSNQVLRYWRNPQWLDRWIADKAHRAFADAYVTAHLLRDMLNEGATVEQLVEWSSQPVLQKRCMFGKHRGKLWTEIETGYLLWARGQDFDEDVAFTVREELERRAAPVARAGLGLPGNMA